MTEISAPVGVLGGRRGNKFDDVLAVQKLLANNGVDPGPLDGKCGGRTTKAIVTFQTSFMSKPDGRVDPGGTTLRKLDGAPAKPKPAPKPTPAPTPAPIPAPTPLPGLGGAVDYTFKLPLPAAGTANVGLKLATNTLMKDVFGLPRDTFSQECLEPTNPSISKHLASTKVGKTNVRGYKPAIDILNKIMEDIAREQPAVFAHLGSAGMLCCRHVRGSQTAISNHSWGTAIDITIDGRVEPRGERDAWLGYALIAPIFNRYGWNWGAAWNTPDCHHFECSAAVIEGFRT